jgi:predicted transcriptional regulator YheO
MQATSRKRKPGKPDRSALEAYFAVADGMAALFKPYVEAVVHDIRSDSVAHVANPFSPREPGDPSDLQAMVFTDDTHVIGPYEKINWDGRRIKSVTIVLRDGFPEANRVPIGLLCINADVTEFDAVRRTLQSFIGMGEPASETEALFRDDWHEKINRFVAAWMAEHATTLDRLDRAGRLALIEALHETGAFEGRRAAAYVARMLGISRATIYATLARLKAGIPA